ncbi:MAG TPA: threonine synthase [Bacillales bacterium]|nr:threonine synthase [Bacillales bacterium]
MAWKGIIDRYSEYLPITSETPKLTLHEGNTPLIHLEKLSQQWDVDLHVKYEGANPTGSFKDRGMVLAVAKAAEEGSEAVICASTGNTSAAAAAYAARLGMRCVIVIPDGKIAYGKLAQASMYGAEIYAVRGNFDEALAMVRSISEAGGFTLVNSLNPYRIEGQKTAAFEVCEALGGAPDVLAIPVGNAANISAYWKGFSEYDERSGSGRPRMHGFEAEGAAAIVRGEPIERPETVATAIRIGKPASWAKAEAAANDSGGTIDFVTDEEILAAYREVARAEGVFAEPASCASLAGVKKQLATGQVEKGSRVVAVLTGNGLKDPDVAVKSAAIEPVTIEAEAEVLRAYLERGVLR